MGKVLYNERAKVCMNQRKVSHRIPLKGKREKPRKTSAIPFWQDGEIAKGIRGQDPGSQAKRSKKKRQKKKGTSNRKVSARGQKACADSAEKKARKKRKKGHGQ